MWRKIGATVGAIVLVCCVFGATQASEQNVVAYLVKKVSVFNQKGESFKRTAKILVEDMPPPPVQVLEASPKGFVKIKMTNGEVWLDTMDVKVEPSKTAGDSTKKHSVSSSSKQKGFHTRGVGE
jgi:hypothetical protein